MKTWKHRYQQDLLVILKNQREIGVRLDNIESSIEETESIVNTTVHKLRSEVASALNISNNTISKLRYEVTNIASTSCSFSILKYLRRLFRG